LELSPGSDSFTPIGSSIPMDDSPLQQHIKIGKKKKKKNLGEAALCRANSHPPQLTWFFTSIYPNLNHNTHLRDFHQLGFVGLVKQEKMRLESIRNS